MITIEIDNINSKILGLSPKNSVFLAESLAMMVPGHEYSKKYQMGMWDGKIHFYQKKSNKFPTGLLPDVIKTLFSLGETNINQVDKRIVIDVSIPTKIDLCDDKIGNIVLRDYQLHSVQNALKIKRGIINIATNGGKTEIACALIKEILPTIRKDQNILFFTSSKQIFSQSVERLNERLHMKVGRIGAGVWQPEQVTVVMIPTLSRYMKKPKELPFSKKANNIQDRIELLVDSLKLKDLKDTVKVNTVTGEIKELKIKKEDLEEERWDKIDEQVNKTKGLLKTTVMFIGDEVHHASSDTWYKLFMSLNNAYFRYGLTGTVGEQNSLNFRRLSSCTGGIISKISNDYLIKKGYSAKPKVYLIELPEMHIGNQLSYPEARRLGIIDNDIRNRAFATKILERAKSGKKCLIIVNEIEHGNIIEDMLLQETQSCIFIHGDTPQEFRDSTIKEFKEGNLSILIATTILDEGVDISGVNCLFLLAGGKSHRQLLQRIGRGLRKKADGSGVEVYDCLDYHNKFLIDHTEERYKVYKSEGFAIVKI